MNYKWTVLIASTLLFVSTTVAFTGFVGDFFSSNPTDNTPEDAGPAELPEEAQQQDEDEESDEADEEITDEVESEAEAADELEEDLPEQAQNVTNLTDQEPGPPEFERLLLEIEPEGFSNEAVQNMGGNVRHEYDIVNAVAIEVPEQAADQLTDLDFVDRVEDDPDTELPDPQPEPDIPEDDDEETSDGDEETDDGDEETDEGEESDEEDTDNEESEEDTEEEDDEVTGNGVSVAVLDTGIADDHAHFDGQVEFNVDFTDEDDPYDYNGHGSHVASIAVGEDEYSSVAPDANIQNIKVLEDDGTGSGSDVIAGIDHAVNNNADVIVLSLGAPVEECDGEDIISETVDEAVNQGVPVAVAAGNEGPGEETVTLPGCSQEGFTTAATTNDEESIVDFSSRGPTTDDRTKPDIAAPGTAITGAEAGTTDSYIEMSGTSMAAPYIGGVFALQIDENPDLSPEEYYQAVRENAEDLGEDEIAQGEGLAQVEETIESIETDEEDDEETDEEDEETEEDTEDGDDEEETDDEETETELEAESEEDSNETSEEETSEQESEETDEEDTSEEDEETEAPAFNFENFVNSIRGLF